MLDHAGDDQLYDLFQVRKRLLAGLGPRRTATVD